MANLDSYIDFSIVLDKSVTTPVIRLTDPNNYPVGIGVYINGVFSITQPDGITVTGNFTSPDIYWSGSALVVASKELRLATDGNFQNGLYTITYVVKCTGYTDTILTKTFTLTYTPKTLLITDLTDVFTPSLEQLDSTQYAQDGFDTPTITRAWSASINYVGSIVRTVTGTAALFDMVYSSNYWDAQYIISFYSIASYVLNSPDNWVTIIDKFTTDYQVDAYTPPTMQSLLAQLTTMKQEVDAGTYCGGKGCGCGCSDEQAFLNAQADYNLLKNSGCNGDTVGIYYLIPQMLKLFTCNGNLIQSHTNAAITAYNFGCGSSSTLHPPIQFTVDSGALYAPISGQPVYDNPTLAGNNAYTIYRQAIGDFLVKDTDFTYNTSGGFTLSSTTFVSGERFTLVFY